MTKWLVVPDMQVPDHDQAVVDAVCDMVKTLRFDAIAIVGDECDAPEPSRWNKGYAGEYAGTLQKNLDKTHDVLAQLRKAVGKDAPVLLMRSNHGERISKYISKYAPALSSLRSLDYASLLGLDELGITYLERPTEFVPGWCLAHGDEGSLIQTPAGTALNLAKRWGKSVVCGHTHRAGLQHHHSSVNGKINQYLFGMEVGHWMTYGNGKNKADYLRAGSANWQQAFGVFTVEGRTVNPQLVTIINKSFEVNGKKWAW